MTSNRLMENFKQRFFQRLAGTLGLKITFTALNVLIGILLARLLGTTGYGTYTYAMTWAGLLSIPASLGLDKLIVREVAIYHTHANWNLMQGLLRWANRIVLCSAVGIALGVAAIAWFARTAMGPQLLFTFWIALIYLPINSLRNLRLATMKGLHQVVMGLLPELCLGPVILIALIGGASVIMPNGLTAPGVVGLHVMATAITLTVGAQLLGQVLPNTVKLATPQYQTSQWTRSALPMMFLGGMQVINSRIDIIMLGAIDNVQAVGIYAVVLRSVQVISLILISVNSVIAPTLASLYAVGNTKQLQQVVTASTRVIMVLSLPLTAMLIGLSDGYLMLSGPTFVQGKAALVILCVGHLANAATGSVGVLLNMTGYERYTAMSVAASAALNIFLNLLLIPRWGIEGAATATSSSLIFVNLVKVMWVHRKLGINSTVVKLT